MDWILKLNYKCQFFLVVPLRLKPGSLLPFASLRIKKLQIQFFATIIYFPTTRSRVVLSGKLMDQHFWQMSLFVPR